MIEKILSSELSCSPRQVSACLALFAEGATVPFIARYRKERTGGLTEEQIRAVESRHREWKEFEKRKEFILSTLEKQGELTSKLRGEIDSCLDKNRLEDIYLPFKQGRATRAQKARDAGLAPIAESILNGSAPGNWRSLLTSEIRNQGRAEGFDSDEKLASGVVDILAEEIANRADIRATLREAFSRDGRLTARAKRGWKTKESKFDRYYEYARKGSTVPPHVLSALFRGENEGILKVEITLDPQWCHLRIRPLIPNPLKEQFQPIGDQATSEALDRLLLPSLASERLRELKEKAEIEACSVFAENLETVLMAPPAGARSVLAIDPGFRTGCKAVLLDPQGTVLTHATIYPTEPKKQTREAADTLHALYRKHPFGLVAVGNGTGGRETERFLKQDLLPLLPDTPKVLSVSESGASVYSASPAGVAEFPDLDVTIRGAISIGRRLQDPLAELVKVPPESIGVGQYQHDIAKRRLARELNSVVESCVNRVGADLNLASVPLLTQISGIGPVMAEKIVAHRREKGLFRSRKELLMVAGLGKKCFEQCAGFLRIHEGTDPLDTTAVHPENYPVVKRIARSLNVSVPEMIRNEAKLSQIAVADFSDASVGTVTLTDILSELKKPARDPRKEFVTVTFDDHYHSMADLSEGVVLPGVVTNVVAFGAFVDIGVHQDGLVHISELADRFVSTPSDVVKPGDAVTVKVISLNEPKKQIGLSIKGVKKSAP